MPSTNTYFVFTINDFIRNYEIFRLVNFIKNNINDINEYMDIDNKKILKDQTFKLYNDTFDDDLKKIINELYLKISLL